MPLTIGAAEVLQRQIILLDNLGTKVSGGHHNKRSAEVRRHILTRRYDKRNKRKSANLPLRPESPRHIRAQRGAKPKDRIESPRKNINEVPTTHIEIDHSMK